MTPPDLETVAAEVWLAAGGPPAPPRDLEPLLPLVAPLFVVPLVGLSAARVFGWLSDHGLPVPEREPPTRPLLGCLVAHAGRGGIFLEANLDAAERRVVAAHEFAHFQLDYQRPRERAVRRLGPRVLSVLDGLQPIDDAVELAAALADVPLGVHSHFLDCDAATEERATALALELLAPGGRVTGANRAEIEAELIAEWGIPRRWAEGYAVQLAHRRQTFAELFRLS